MISDRMQIEKAENGFVLTYCDILTTKTEVFKNYCDLVSRIAFLYSLNKAGQKTITKVTIQ